MFRRHSLIVSIILLAAFAPFLPAQPNKEKTVWNYDGGIFLETDGSLPSGSCFRLNGRGTAPDFFENLKREDSSLGTMFHRGPDIVTEFPDQLHLSFMMYDMPCSEQLRPATPRVYLTRDAVSSLRLSFFWKHGVQMRPVKGIVRGPAGTRRIPPYATEYADQLPERLEWLFEFDVPSAGVPLSDSLVVVMRTSDGHIAARAALRM
jgi:hypothetical protein